MVAYGLTSKRIYVYCCYIMMIKAFDSVVNAKLLEYLEQLGLQEEAIDRIKDYLNL